MSALSNPGKEYTADELRVEGACAGRQRDLSRQLTVLVDVLYALVLVQGAEAYRSLFTTGDEFLHLSRFLPVVLALVLIYFTAIHSFIDFHLASEDQPYQFLDLANRKKDLWRFYLDVVIVGLYSFILLKCHVLLGSPGADILPAFIALAAVFALFIAWGALREKTAPPGRQSYSVCLLGLCLLLYVSMAIGYAVTSNSWIGNSEFLAAALLVMVFYRWMNWRQNRWCTALPAKAATEEEDTAEGQGASS